MNAQEIISKIENGQYKVEYNEECSCNFYWHIKKGELENDMDGNECWTGNALYVSDENGELELVAEYIRYDGWKIYTDDLDIGDLPEKVRDEMNLNENLQRGEDENEAHAQRERETLIDFLMEGNYELGRDDERGFGNEYTMTLREVESPITVTSKEAEEWANDYLYAGDAVTEAFVGFVLVNNAE